MARTLALTVKFEGSEDARKRFLWDLVYNENDLEEIEEDEPHSPEDFDSIASLVCHAEKRAKAGRFNINLPGVWDIAFAEFADGSIRIEAEDDNHKGLLKEIANVPNIAANNPDVTITVSLSSLIEDGPPAVSFKFRFGVLGERSDSEASPAKLPAVPDWTVNKISELSFEDLYNIGRFLYKRGDYDTGIFVLDHAIKTANGNTDDQSMSRILEYCGMCHSQKGGFSAAAGCFRRAMELDPDYKEYKIRLAQAEAELGTPDITTQEEALDFVRLFPEQFKKIPEDFMNKEVCLTAVKHFASMCAYIPEKIQSQKFFTEAVKTNENGKAIKFIPAGCLSKNVCAAAFKSHPYALSSGELNDLGLSLYNNDYFDAAITVLDRAIEADEENDGAWETRALCYFDKGDYAAAVKDLEKAIELDPDCQNYKDNLEVSRNNLAGERAALISTEEEAFDFVSKYPSLLPKIPVKFQTRRLCLAGIKSFGSLLEDIPEIHHCEDFFLEAVSVNEDGKALLYVPFDYLSKEIIDKAMRRIAAMQHIGGALDVNDINYIVLSLCRKKDYDTAIFLLDYLKLENSAAPFSGGSNEVAAAWSLRGFCYSRIGDHAAAVFNIKKAIELDPDNEGYKNCLAAESFKPVPAPSLIFNSEFEIEDSVLVRYLGETSGVEIPKWITSIGEGAFQACKNLAYVSLPEGITTIGDGAFYGCSKLSRINWPKELTRIGEAAFWQCTGLTDVSLPQGLKAIGDAAFYGCSKLISISIPDSLIDIGELVFYGCPQLKNICLPEELDARELGIFNNDDDEDEY